MGIPINFLCSFFILLVSMGANNLICLTLIYFSLVFQATTINCRRLCFSTFNMEWQNNWQKFYAECLGEPQETDLTQCIEEGTNFSNLRWYFTYFKYLEFICIFCFPVEAPCSLGCAGLTYCSQLNNRPTSLFRSCSAQADLDAHLAVAEQKDSGYDYRKFTYIHT